ncbi:hypothetical protein [Aurantibacillus circumpalustris]|uniref:hypothetical protein n=1 Tax=Aurantibacillus circumpalustris TaxID=3036359 RepID=UPI00295A7B0E|nr:hypothetical protein [Aurantibacillus circumpalustris]
MSKQNVNITSLAELEQQERLVRTRIKLQEIELSSRIKKLPEELVATAVIGLVSSALKGTALKSLINFAKRVGKNVFSNILKDIL